MATPAVQRTALLAALSDLQYELVPVTTIREEARHLPVGARVTVTASPRMGLERTIDAAEDLAGDGFTVIPHLTARQIRDVGHLSEIVDRLVTAGVDNVMVLAGDAKSPAGGFVSALELLRTLDSLGRPFTQIGVAGYPEGHPFLSPADLQRALLGKADYATYIVTQMCFSADTVKEWLSEIRKRGIRLPVHIGIPGKVSQTRLLAVATRIGVGESLRFLTRNPRNVLRLLISSDFDPGILASRLEDCLSMPGGAAGFHVYTFNAVAATESWRREFMRQLQGQ